MRFTILLLSLFVFSASFAVEITYFSIKDSATPLQMGGSLEEGDGVVSDVLWEIIKDRSDISVVSQTLPFMRVIRAMEQGTHKNWISYGAKGWTTPQAVRLSKTPIFTAKNQFLTKKGVRFNSVEELFGKRIVLIRGFGYPGLDQYVKSGKIKVAWVENYMRAITAVKLNRGVGFVGMRLRIMYNLRKLGYNSDLFDFADFSATVPNYDIHFCFSNDFPDDLYSLINKGLARLRKSGRVKEILHQYMKN